MNEITEDNDIDELGCPLFIYEAVEAAVYDICDALMQDDADETMAREVIANCVNLAIARWQAANHE